MFLLLFADESRDAEPQEQNYSDGAADDHEQAERPERPHEFLGSLADHELVFKIANSLPDDGTVQYTSAENGKHIRNTFEHAAEAVVKNIHPDMSVFLPRIGLADKDQQQETEPAHFLRPRESGTEKITEDDF